MGRHAPKGRTRSADGHQKPATVRASGPLFLSRPRHEKSPPGGNPKRANRASIFARQQDHTVGEVQVDFRQGKVGVVDGFREHHAAVAVLANQAGAAVGLHCQFPKLEFHGGDGLLGERDGVQQPVRAALLGDVPRAVGVEDMARERVAIPVLGPGEGSQGVGGQALVSVSHDLRSFHLSDPHGGGTVRRAESEQAGGQSPTREPRVSAANGAGRGLTERRFRPSSPGPRNGSNECRKMKSAPRNRRPQRKVKRGHGKRRG